MTLKKFIKELTRLQEQGATKIEFFDVKNERVLRKISELEVPGYEPKQVVVYLGKMK